MQIKVELKMKFVIINLIMFGYEQAVVTDLYLIYAVGLSPSKLP